MGEEVKGVLFDLDGTLVDSNADIATAFNIALAGEGIQPLNKSEIVVGYGLRKTLQHALHLRKETVSPRREQELLDVMFSCCLKHLSDYDTPYPDMAKLREGLSSPFGVLSNKNEQVVLRILQKLFPSLWENARTFPLSRILARSSCFATNSGFEPPAPYCMWGTPRWMPCLPITRKANWHWSDGDTVPPASWRDFMQERSA